MTDIGYIATLLAFVVSIYAAVAAVLGAREGFPELVHSARRGVYAVFGLLTLAELVLAYALLSHDFGLRYVWEYTSLDMATPYLLSAIYAGNDGSLLFWAWVLSILAALAAFLDRKERVFAPYVAATNMAVAAFFLLLVSLIANPFERLASTPADGRGLNPMLENVGMLFHPPTLYLGYVGLTIPFAFLLAALATGRLDGEWIKRTRMWALLAWLMLGIGNLLGAQWAYVELGWGGYWAWDPVENASLMPWLIITAYLHATVVQRRRRMFRVWTASLAATAFLLSIFGTFITRSGLITSVHAFGQSSLGPFFLAFIALGGALSLGLILWRLDLLRGEEVEASFMSRENWVFITNLLLAGATVAVLFGTVYPTFSEVALGRKIELGKDFYNQVNGPILLVLVAAMGICPVLAWGRTLGQHLAKAFTPPALAAVALAVALVALGVRQYVAIVALAVFAFVILVYVGEWYRGVRARQRTQGVNPVSALGGMIWDNRPRYGAHIVHVAIAVMAIGVVGSTFFVSEAEANLKVGESMAVGSYAIRYEGMAQSSTPSRNIVSATVTVLQDGRPLGQMTAENIFHKSMEQPVSEVAIRTTPLEDVYVIFAGWDADGSASFRVLINPLVVWIWVGGVLFLLGGLVAMWPAARAQEREETAAEEAREAVPTVA